MKIAFFGTPEIAVTVLQELAKAGIIPDLIVANPDAKVGRTQIITPPPTILWANARSIPIFQPDTLKEKADLLPISNIKWDLFIVVAYGKIMPRWLVELPEYGTLNVHPSLLPHLRGASPIRSAILNDMRQTGVTIMRMDEKMDHGPIIATEAVTIDEAKWPIDGQEFDTLLATVGGKLLATVIPDYLAGVISPVEQNHAEATFSRKITKEMGELKLDPYKLPSGELAYQLLCKIRAFSGWPETFFIHESKRIKIKAARLAEDGSLLITRIIPEGKKEMDFASYFT